MHTAAPALMSRKHDRDLGASQLASAIRYKGSLCIHVEGNPQINRPFYVLQDSLDHRHMFRCRVILELCDHAHCEFDVVASLGGQECEATYRFPVRKIWLLSGAFACWHALLERDAERGHFLDPKSLDNFSGVIGLGDA